MTKIVMIPGYNHDPSSKKHSPDRIPAGHFHIWNNGVLKGYETQKFHWYSGRQFRDLLKAWRAGYPDTYKWAYCELAHRAAERLIKEAPIGSVAFAHSLGTKVVREALELSPGHFSKVICLNGAVHNYEMLETMDKNRRTAFLNLAVKSDSILSLAGAWFGPKFGKHPTIGNGLAELPSHARQVILDDPEQQKRYRDRFGWDIRGDNPRAIGDHSYSFNWSGNWPLIQAELDDALTVSSSC